MDDYFLQIVSLISYTHLILDPNFLNRNQFCVNRQLVILYMQHRHQNFGANTQVFELEILLIGHS